MKTNSSSHPLETVLGLGLRRLLIWGVPLSALGLVFPAPEPENGLLPYTLTHLVVLQVAAFLLTVEIAHLTDTAWFPKLSRPWLASVASLIAAVVGFSALLTLATSAAARYDVSLQFLQLLSSLDIAWVVAALYLGVRRLRGRGPAIPAGLALLGACVVSIGVYLATVGFTPEGGWLVNGAEMLRIVISSDTVAAIISLSVLLIAARKADQPTAQERLQS